MSGEGLAARLAPLAPLALDEEVVDYIASILQEHEASGDAEDARDAILPLLADTLGDEPAAVALCNQLLCPDAAPDAAPDTTAATDTTPDTPPVELLAAPIVMAEHQRASSDAAPLRTTTAAAASSSPASSRKQRRQRKKRANREGGDAQQQQQGEEQADSVAPESGVPKGVLWVHAQPSRFHVDTGDNTTIGEVFLKDVCIEISGQVILKGAELHFFPGDRYGLIGRNGVGKTTLLKQMANASFPGWPSTLVTLLVDQEDTGDARTAVETVLAANAEMGELRAQESVLCAAQRDGAFRLGVLRYEALLAGQKHAQAAAYSAKTTGQRGKQARDWLIEAEEGLAAAHARVAAEAAAPAGGGGPAPGSAGGEGGAGTGAGGDADPEARVAELVAQVQERLLATGAEEAESTIRKILSGLGFTREMVECPTESLSGGWRMRVALAQALFAEPHVLLLDEPTNHLDVRAVVWLEAYLTNNLQDTAIVVVSHDRAFLDAVATHCVEMKRETLAYHEGNYTVFEERKAQKVLDAQRQADALKKQRDTLTDQISRWERDARKTKNDKQLKQVASRKKKLDRTGVERNAKGHRFKLNRDRAGYHLTARGEVDVEGQDDHPIRFTLRAADPLGYYGPLLQLDEVAVGYEAGQPVVSGFSLDIDLKSRVVFLGHNGAGKSTLLRTITGDLSPLRGAVKRHPRLRVSHFTQHSLDSLPGDQSALSWFLSRFDGATEQAVRGHLSAVGIFDRTARLPLPQLSGGQRCRVCLASLTFKPPHILCLDEPTNHLDLETVRGMSESLKAFQGGLILVSHDRRLVTEVGEAFFMVREGAARPFDAAKVDAFFRQS